MNRFTLRLAAVVAFALACWAPAAQAQESFQVQSVDALGCNSGDFDMSVLRSNLDGGPSYTVHTVVTVGGLIYMNEAASISINGTSGWSVFNIFSYGPVPNQGTYPIPSGQQMRLDFTLERPQGGPILFTWTLVVDGCNTGVILYNGVTPAIPSQPVPALSPGGMAALAMALLLAFAWVRRRERVTRAP